MIDLQNLLDTFKCTNIYDNPPHSVVHTFVLTYGKYKVHYYNKDTDEAYSLAYYPKYIHKWLNDGSLKIVE